MKKIGEILKEIPEMEAIPRTIKDSSNVPADCRTNVVKIGYSDKTCPKCGERYRREVLDGILIQEYSTCDCAKMRIAGISDLTFAKFDRAREPIAYDIAVNYCDRVVGWLLFVGINGSGKTHLAGAITNELRKNHRFQFVTNSDILDYVKRNNWQCEVYKDIDLLVIDELGACIESDWSRSVMYEVVSYRERERKPTIFTTNYNSDELHEKVGAPSMDRILGLSKIVKMESLKSYRIKNK